MPFLFQGASAAEAETKGVVDQSDVKVGKLMQGLRPSHSCTTDKPHPILGVAAFVCRFLAHTPKLRNPFTRQPSNLGANTDLNPLKTMLRRAD